MLEYKTDLVIFHKSIFVSLWTYQPTLLCIIAQSAGTVEYTDCTYAEG